MDYAAVLQEIKKGHIRPIYLLYGEETYLLNRIVRAVVDAVISPDEQDANLVVFDREPSPGQLAGILETVPFMGEKQVVVVRDTVLLRAAKTDDKTEEEVSEKKLSASSDNQLYGVLSNMPPYTHLIFAIGCKKEGKSYKDVNKRTKLYKLIEAHGATVEFAPLKPKDVKGWLQSKLVELNKRMAPDAEEHLLASVSIMPQVSLGFLENELEKAALYVGQERVITRQALLDIGSTLPEVSVFAMLDALSQRQVKTALKLLAEQLGSGEHPLKIVAMLARQIRLLWQAKDLDERGCGSQQIAEALGLMPFIAEKMMRQSRKFSTAKLKNAALLLAEADQDLKLSKTSSVALERIVIELCQ